MLVTVSDLCSCQGTSDADGCRDRIDRPSVGERLCDLLRCERRENNGVLGQLMRAKRHVEAETSARIPFVGDL